MIKFAFIIAICLITGCAAMNKGDILQRFSQSRQLSSAVDLLEKGDTAEASRLLTNISTSGSFPGVTDEALFRLALLSLKSAEKEGPLHAQQLLKRLKKEYPASSWTVQAMPLGDLLGSIEELRRQNKNYKSLNQSLTKEVNELNDNINKLKHLDLELEKKNR